MKQGPFKRVQHQSCLIVKNIKSICIFLTGGGPLKSKQKHRTFTNFLAAGRTTEVMLQAWRGVAVAEEVGGRGRERGGAQRKCSKERRADVTASAPAGRPSPAWCQSASSRSWPSAGPPLPLWSPRWSAPGCRWSPSCRRTCRQERQQQEKEEEEDWGERVESGTGWNIMAESPRNRKWRQPRK